MNGRYKEQKSFKKYRQQILKKLKSFLISNNFKCKWINLFNQKIGTDRVDNKK